MKHHRPDEGWYQRFLRWAGGEEPDGVEGPEDPERAEFQEYLEYIEAHGYMEFGAYRLMRLRERREKGLFVPDKISGHWEQAQPHPAPKKRRHRPGRLRHELLIYRVLSGVVTPILAVIFLAVAFDTFGESAVLFAAAVSTLLLLQVPGRRPKEYRGPDELLGQVGRRLMPVIFLFGAYVVVNGHLSPGGGFSGGAVLGAGLILASLSLGEERMDRILPPSRTSRITVVCLLAYGLMKGYSFYTGANHVGWDIPKGTPGAIFSGGLILPLNICVGVIVACTMYTFYTLFLGGEERHDPASH